MTGEPEPIIKQYELRSVWKTKNTYHFHHQRRPLCATAKLILFAVSNYEWDTKEELVCKSMKSALYVHQYANRHFSGRSDTEQGKKIKPVASDAMDLHLNTTVNFFQNN